jgi:hypothetical protein
MSCGCKKPDERHGDDRNIIRQDLEDAASAANISADQVVKNILESFQATSGNRAATAGEKTQ